MCSHDNAWRRGPFLNLLELKMVNHDNNKRAANGTSNQSRIPAPAPARVQALFAGSDEIDLAWVTQGLIGAVGFETGRPFSWFSF